MKKQKPNGLNVFGGAGSILDYTDPEKHAPTSIVELPLNSELNPFHKRDRIRIFVKMMGAELPGSTFKLVPVNQWFKEQKKRGALTKDTIVVINSSGGAGLAAVAKGMAMGVKKVVVYMPEDTPPEKQMLIKRAGGELHLTKDVPGEPSSVEAVRTMAKLKNHLVFDQYADPANIRGHMKTTMEQVWRQLASLGSFPGVVVAAKGTTGTLLAARNYAKMHSEQTLAVGVECAEGEPIPAVRPESRLGPKQIKFNHMEGTRRVKVKRYESYQLTGSLLKHAALKVGLSTGAALAGAHQFVASILHTAEADGLRDKRGWLNVVVISGDILDPYLAQLRVILDAKDL